MKPVKPAKQVSLLMKYFDQNKKIFIENYNGQKFININGAIYSDTIIGSIVFDIANILIRKQLDAGLTLTQEEIDNIKSLLSNYLIAFDNDDTSKSSYIVCDKDMFNVYSVSGDIAFVEGSSYGINTTDLIEVINQAELALGSEYDIVCGGGYLYIVSKLSKNPVIIKKMIVLQQSFF